MRPSHNMIGKSRVKLCPGSKKQMYTEQEADRLLMVMFNPQKMQTYRCLYCREWHIGHKQEGAR